MFKSALSSQHYGPWLVILIQEINRLFHWREADVLRPIGAYVRGCSVNPAKDRLVAQTQGRQCVYLL
jgi:hypothetical protein